MTGPASQRNVSARSPARRLLAAVLRSLLALVILLGLALIAVGSAALAPWLEKRFGIFLAVQWPGSFEWILAALVLVAAIVFAMPQPAAALLAALCRDLSQRSIDARGRHARRSR